MFVREPLEVGRALFTFFDNISAVRRDSIVADVRLTLRSRCEKSQRFGIRLHSMALRNLDADLMMSALSVLDWQMKPQWKVDLQTKYFHVLYFQQVLDSDLSKTHLPAENFRIAKAKKLAHD